MYTRRLVAGSLALPVLVTVALAQAPAPLPALDNKPVPQLDPHGPSAAVTALAFGPDGQTLYAAGLDKVVRVWARQNEQFALKAAYRVPIGPGNAGAVNAVALSPDGAWVAMAGRAPMRGEAGFRRGGVIVEAAALSPEQNEDVGLIYVARTDNPAGGKVLRGHRGEVRALAFAPARDGKPPLLVSAATERDGARRFGGLRLWDVAAGRSLAERNDLPAKDEPAGLAVWHTGPGATEVRVAVAWREAGRAKESYFRLWSPAAGALQEWEGDPYTQTAALLGQEDGAATVLTGGLGENGGRLLRWRLSADRKAGADFGPSIALPSRAGVAFRPISLAVVPGYAVVALQPSARDTDFRLAVIDLRTSRVVADVPLPGSDTERLPAVAAAVRGRQVAVAAARDHAVRVYALADLIAGRAEPETILAGDGLAPQRVAFVDKGRGLWLSEDEAARPLSGGLVFDLDKGQVRANEGGLAADAPELGEWSFAIERDDKGVGKGVSVRQGGKDLPPMRPAAKDAVVTAAALRPPAAGRPGVLAVAYTERGASRTLIALRDPADARPYRLLVGHLQDVRELAFSASRPLLASVGDDQTLCVWSLADLDRAVGEVPGLGVGDGDGKAVVVRRVEPGSAAAKEGLSEGDVL